MTHKDKLEKRRAILLLWLIILVAGCQGVTSADEAELVQQGLGEQEIYAAEATRGSAHIDLQATATAHSFTLNANATAAAAGAQLTATAVPVNAAAHRKRTETKTNALNAAWIALGIAAAITLPITGLAIAKAAWAASKHAQVVRVKQDELVVVGGYLIDGATGSTRLLGHAREQLTGRIAVRITHALPAPDIGGDWIEGVVKATKAEYDELGREDPIQLEARRARQLGACADPDM